jgi:hypothetical protein
MPLAAEQKSGIMAHGVWRFTWTPFGIGTEVWYCDGSTHAASVKLEHAGCRACSLVEENGGEAEAPQKVSRYADHTL